VYVCICVYTHTDTHEVKSKSKVSLPVEALHSTNCESWQLSHHTRHCRNKSVSGLVSVVFVYESSLKMAALLSNCTVVEQQALIFSFFSCGQST
jgi:hypothetical protein